MSDRSYGWIDAELFWSNVHQHGPNGCHVWQLSVGLYNCPKVYGKTNGRGTAPLHDEWRGHWRRDPSPLA